MKKFIVMFAAAVLGAGALSAQNHPYGIDVGAGPVLNLLAIDDDEFNSLAVTGGIQLKADTFDCFALNNMLGIYGSLSMPIVFPGKEYINYGSTTETEDHPESSVGVDCIIGPAFGVNIGDSGVRFQVGAGFHMLALFSTFDDKMSEPTRQVEIFTGMGYDAQFRFSANRRLSPVVGLAGTVDWGYQGTAATYVNNAESGRTSWDNSDYKSCVHYSFMPYVALGINLGK